ncbi:SDR family NAD(P)-dependent oxidoreductase [Amnibacterium kyonggiense]|uniref:Gluconate 5-dehydrogenase n=1 Tax=Amnibacterium kyonggiense TaxID=595671 RepID=A0A4R7FS97_9MICO|nr:SDR family oxidoreductase [Amnibacterium kyonggiense]TDS80721.1 gluconate 5-dehydrogenase [Amnibacterium kyonggiense]
MTVSEHLSALFSLEGRTAVVTGGSSGIGRAIAAALAGAGARTVLVARDAERLAAAAAAMEGEVLVVPADLGARDGVRAAAEAIVAAAGEPDVVVSAAGVNLRPPMPEVDEAVWDATMRLNLDAPFLLGQRFGPGMAERGFGRLIAISSQQAHRAFVQSGAYGVSKAALEGLARSQAEAWSASGVTSNVLVPGFVLTPLNARLQEDPARVAALAQRTMVGRNGLPEDFATAALFLASPASGYVTGQSIAVDGGFSVH